MSELRERAKEELSLDPYKTLEQAATDMGVAYHALRMWLVRNPTIPIKRIADVLVVHRDQLNKYNHR